MGGVRRDGAAYGLELHFESCDLGCSIEPCVAGSGRLTLSLSDRRDGEKSMHARVSFYEGTPGGDVDTAVKGFEDALEPLQQMKGHRAATLLVDRGSGKAITITYWDTEEDLESSAEQANRLRKEVADTGGLSVRAVENYEVALDSRP